MEKVTVNITGVDDDWEASGDAAVVIVMEKAEDDAIRATEKQWGNPEAIPPSRFAVCIGSAIRMFLEYCHGDGRKHQRPGNSDHMGDYWP